MSAPDRRRPSPEPSPEPAPESAEDLELERIAQMSDDELAAHLQDSGVDVAALDAQVDSIREQMVASGIGAPAPSSRQPAAVIAHALGRAGSLGGHPRTPGPLGRVLVVCMVVIVAVAAGTALASLLR
jgi:hypothetical protein